MGTTTNLALPYPEPSDRARNGSVAMRALAEAVDDRARNTYITVVNANVATALSDNVWTDVPWTSSDTSEVGAASDFTIAGNTITLEGPAGLYLISYSVGVFAITKNARLAFSGGAQPVTADYSSTSQYSTLGRETLAYLTPGVGIGLQVMGGTGGGSPSFSDASLFVVRL